MCVVNLVNIPLNPFQGITVHSKQAVENAKKTAWPSQTENNATVVEAPGGYKFYLVNEDVSGGIKILFLPKKKFEIH